MFFEVTLHQMVIFFLILAVGFVAGKTHIIKKEYLPHLAQIITKILLPILIFNGTITSTTWENLLSCWQIIAFSVVFYAVLAGVLWVLAKIMRLKGDRDKVFTFCFLFGNTGFVGIPLLVALFPEHGMLYMCVFSIVDQLVFWTFGIWLATSRDRKAKLSPKSLVTPNTIAIVLALLVVVTGLDFPKVIDDTLSVINNATSAMCMMYLGAMVCFSKWGKALACKELYVGILVKMVALPVALWHVLVLIGLPQELVVSLVVIASLPVMTVVPMIASTHGNEGEYATGITVVTLVVSILSIPLVQFLVTL